VLRAHTTICFDLLIIMGLFVAIGLCTNLASPDQAQAEAPMEKQLPKRPPVAPPSKPEPPRKASPRNKEKKATGNQAPAQQSAPGKRQSASKPKQQPPRKTEPIPKPHATSKFQRAFVASLTNAPFPYSGKDADPHFFDFIDPKTGERYRTTRTLERLSEKDHYRDSSVLFYVPKRFNPNRPFVYVVFLHGNRSDVQQCLKDYRLDEQIESSGKNAILLLPQLAKNASDSSPGKFSRKNVFRAFMQEAALVLSQTLGKKFRRPLEQAPIILAAFSGGYKPLACSLDRGGADSRIKAVLLLDALYEDLYIFGKWVLSHAGGGVFVNIFTEGSACEERTGILAQFLREHRVPFKEEWPKGSFAKRQICLIGSSSEHLQIPVEGPPREPLAALLQKLKI
jgi:hypothetical protein